MPTRTSVFYELALLNTHNFRPLRLCSGETSAKRAEMHWETRQLVRCQCGQIQAVIDFDEHELYCRCSVALLLQAR